MVKALQERPVSAMESKQIPHLPAYSLNLPSIIFSFQEVPRQRRSDLVHDGTANAICQTLNSVEIKMCLKCLGIILKKIYFIGVN
jgi:hypothetical protein